MHAKSESESASTTGQGDEGQRRLDTGPMPPGEPFESEPAQTTHPSIAQLRAIIAELRRLGIRRREYSLAIKRRERARCSRIVRSCFGGGLWDDGYECVREIENG